MRDSNYCTVKEVSAMSGSRRETVLRHLKQGTLKGSMVNRRWLIPKEEAERFAADPPRVGTIWTPPPAGFLSVEEAAEMVGQGEHLVRGHIRSGKLKARFLGGRWCIKPKDVEEYLRERNGESR